MSPLGRTAVARCVKRLSAGAYTSTDHARKSACAAQNWLAYRWVVRQTDPVFRIPMIIGAFGLGALLTWSVTPNASTRETIVVKYETTDPGEMPAAIHSDSEEDRIGIPPDTATAVGSAPGAGQKRALAQVLRALEQPPSDVAADPELAAHLSEKIHERLLSMQGEEP